MADKALLPFRRVANPVDQRLRDQHQRRNLRIAIRQLERAELYLQALYSLELDDREAYRTVDDIVQRLRDLRRYLAERRVSLRAV
jgi:hypothetical protein